MPFKKGQSGNPTGRRPGSRNKRSKAILDKILKVTEELQRSPKTSLAAIAREDPKWFYERILKMVLPKNLEILNESAQKREYDLGQETRSLLDNLYKQHKKRELP
jgi:hypothetical protein